MILLNKTMMCGGLVVLSPGSPSQVVCAILIMQFHMLLVLKTAPYIKDSEDWSSFLSSLGLTLTYTGALVQMLRAQRRRDEFDPEELSYASVAMDSLPVICVSTVVGIMIFVDSGLWNFLRGKRGGASKKDVKANTSLTQVKPINSAEEGNNGPDDGEAPGLRVWDTRQTVDSMDGKTLRAVRLQFGASSKEYMAATELMQEVAQVPKQESRSASGSIL